MSSKAQKIFGGRSYRERGQTLDRQHLGRLEKKKDYKIRANAYSRKAERLKILHRLADNKNPDEFYHRMVSAKLKGGVHITEEDEVRASLVPQKDGINETSQALKYMTSKRVSENNKINRLKKNLPHLSWSPDENLNESSRKQKAKSHLVFVDSKDDLDKFEAPVYFDTHPQMMSRKFNRPKSKQLMEFEFQSQSSSLSAYREIAGRIDRHEKLYAIESKLRQKKNLSDSYNRPIAKLKDESKTSPAIYKWSCRRMK